MITHRLSGVVEYSVWKNIRQRCLNPTSQAYSKYGARGITISDEWLSFENFYKDMGSRPSNDYSIDRIDNNGNYEKGNCRWATTTQQNRNKGWGKINESGQQGVNRTRTSNRWEVRIRINTKLLFLGTYDTVEEAVKVRKQAELTHWKEV